MAPPKAREPRARRTVKACVICHKKKVRCDIDDIEGDICTPCAKDGYECVPRERKRKRFTFSPSPPAQRPAKAASTFDDSAMGDAAFSAAPRPDSRTGPFGGLTLEMGPDHGAKSESEFGSTASLRDPSPLLDRHPDPAYPTLHHSMPSTTAGSAYQPSNVVSYLGRLEYLRNDVPVDDDAGLPNKVPHSLSETDVEILRIQRVSELPPRPVRDSLMDAFWAKCYPWTPVVDREKWIDNRHPNQVSLLLQHAMCLAGSRVSAPIPNHSSEDFYKKARLLFWMGAEEDPIITLAASLLLHWWNPEGPERVSLDTSSFWLRICCGLAYQVGLHREPVGKTDAGLRRRIWWSLVVRDCLINAGHGRPRALNLKLADVSPITTSDFDGALGPGSLFMAYVGISCILGDLTQSYLRKHGLQEHKKSLEDRLFRWLKTLPDHLQLCHPADSRPLKPYSFETRQIHIQYFTTLVILYRPPEPKFIPTAASLLASSFVAGVFEDFMARDELRYLGPIFTFYCLTAGMAQLSCYKYPGFVNIAEDNLTIIERSLEELSRRWPSAVGSLKHLRDVRQKLNQQTAQENQRPQVPLFPDMTLPSTTAQFFSDFGPDLCRMWNPILNRLPQTALIAPRELETAGILQGLRTPAAQQPQFDLGFDANANAALQQQMMASQLAQDDAMLEPTLLQPQEWFGPYGGIGNWLTMDWADQGFGTF